MLSAMFSFHSHCVILLPLNFVEASAVSSRCLFSCHLFAGKISKDKQVDELFTYSSAFLRVSIFSVFSGSLWLILLFALPGVGSVAGRGQSFVC